MNHLTISNGLSAQDTSREKRKEEQGQACLQCEAYSFTGDSLCKQKRERYAYIENTSERVKPLLLKNISSVSEVLAKLYDEYPHLQRDFIGVLVSDTRQGTLRRKYFTDTLPWDVEFLYLTLYLKKHISS